MRLSTLIVWGVGILAGLLLVSSAVLQDAVHVLGVWGMVGALPTSGSGGGQAKLMLFGLLSVAVEWFVVIQHPGHLVNTLGAWFLSLVWLGSTTYSTTRLRANLQRQWQHRRSDVEADGLTYRVCLGAVALFGLDLCEAETVVVGSWIAMVVWSQSVRRRIPMVLTFGALASMVSILQAFHDANAHSERLLIMVSGFMVLLIGMDLW